MLFRTFNQKLLYDTNDTLLINQRCENVNLLGALSENSRLGHSRASRLFTAANEEFLGTNPQGSTMDTYLCIIHPKSSVDTTFIVIMTAFKRTSSN